jgi:tape measure domain-containing protein
MAVVADEVLVRLRADNARYNADVRNSEGIFARSMMGMQNSARAMSRAVATSFGALGVGVAVRSLVQLADAAKRTENALKVAGLSGQSLKAVYDDLFASAQRNAVPLENLATLYGRLALVQDDLKVSQQELLGFTDNIAKALRVSGKSAAEASGALLQLSQALGGGVVRAEEFNSILEGALPIAQAAAAGLEEAGGSVAKLRQLVIEGKISSEAFFRAIEAGASTLDGRLAGAELTVSQSFVRLQNVLQDSVGKLDKAFGASNSLGGALEELGGDIAGIAQSLIEAKQPLIDFISLLGGAVEKIQQFALEAPKLGFLEEFGFNAAKWVNDLGMGSALSAGSTLGGRTLTGTFKLIGETGMDEALAAALLGGGTGLITPSGPSSAPRRGIAGRHLNPTAVANKTVSMENYPVLPGSGTGGKGRSPAERFEAELQAIEDRTAALDLETAALGRGTAEKEKALAVEDLLNAARDAGLKMSPEIRASIDAAAEAYARAAQYMEDMRREQDRINEGIDEFKGVAKDLFGGFIQDLRDGKTAAEALGNVFDKLADKLIDIAVNNLVELAFGALLGGGGSPVTGIGKFIGNLFGRREGGGPVTAGQPYIVGEKRAEVFVPSVNGMIKPSTGGAGSAIAVVRMELSEDLNARILSVSGPVAVEVTRNGIQQFDQSLRERSIEKDVRYG